MKKLDKIKQIIEYMKNENEKTEKEIKFETLLIATRNAELIESWADLKEEIIETLISISFDGQNESSPS